MEMMCRRSTKNSTIYCACQMKPFLKAEKPNLRTLCGLTHEETELDLSGQELRPGDAKLLAPEISVITSLTSVR